MEQTAGRSHAWVGHPPFLMGVVVLAAAAVLNGPVARWCDIKQGKRPLPLKAPLNSLSESALSPYRIVSRHVLEPALVEALGTEHYLSWTVEDASVPTNDPLRIANLLVTYDTGGHNLVPHTPDVCYLGAGYAPAQGHEDTRIALPGLDGNGGGIPLRVCTFSKTAVFGGERITVIYTFHCNGQFVSTRTGVRWLLNDLRTTYAYFSKVEVSFPLATREQGVAGAQKLFERLLPQLVRHHWPDAEAAEKALRQGITEG